MNKELAKLDAALADPLLFSQDRAKAVAVTKKRAEAARKLADAEARWIKAAEEYEAARAEALT
jgi:ATP-binding cassette subfamily F protein 3